MTAIKTVILIALSLNFNSAVRAEPPLPATVALSPIENAAEKKQTLRQISDDLARYAPVSTLLDCPTLMDYNEQMPSGHDSSFGGVCKIRQGAKTKLVTLCDDRMIGKFFQSDSVLERPEQIGRFIRAHCPPGG